MITLPKKIKPIHILGVLSGISMLFLYAYTRPRNTKVPEPTDQTKPQIQSQDPRFNNATPSGYIILPEASFPQLPSTLPVYQGEDNPLTLRNLAESLATYFKLSPSKTLSSYWSTPDNSEFLSINVPDNSVAYQFDGGLKPDVYKGNKNPTVDSAVKAASDFLSLFPQWKNFSPESEKIAYYLLATGHFEKTTPARAGIIEVPFIEKIDEFPIRHNSRTVQQIVIWVGQNNRIVRVVVYPNQLQVGGKLTDRETLPSSDALSLLKSNKAEIIDVSADFSFSQIYKTLPEISIKKITVEYRFDSTTKLVAPYYRFEGTVKPKGVPLQNIVLILPAVKF